MRYRHRRQGWLVAVFALLVVVSLADVAQAQIFQPLDDYTSQFSTFMQSRLARSLGLVGMLGLMIIAITTRGHGMEIAVAALLLGVGLFFMFGADRYIFPFFGFGG
jgi:hypothetical protein